MSPTPRHQPIPRTLRLETHRLNYTSLLWPANSGRDTNNNKKHSGLGSSVSVHLGVARWLSWPADRQPADKVGPPHCRRTACRAAATRGHRGGRPPAPCVPPELKVSISAHTRHPGGALMRSAGTAAPAGRAAIRGTGRPAVALRTTQFQCLSLCVSLPFSAAETRMSYRRQPGPPADQARAPPSASRSPCRTDAPRKRHWLSEERQ